MSGMMGRLLAFPAKVAVPASVPAPSSLLPMLARHPLAVALATLGLGLAGGLAIGSSLRQAVPDWPAPMAVTSPAPALPAAVALPVEAPRPATPPVAAPAEKKPPPARAVAAASRSPATARPAATPPEDGSRVLIRRSSREPAIQPLAAWEAFQAGDMDAARTAYEEVLRLDPRNTDALHGLAAIARRQGREELARELYLRILDIAPRDAVAEAALSASGERDGGEGESRLKTLAAADPAAPAVRFALGNLYARQGRWAEAEQAYFDAVALAPDDPDCHYNLAVSLDQLGRARLAARYYGNALALAAGRPAAFEPERVRVRLQELEAR